MIVDDVDGFKMNTAEFYLLCETCHCTCNVKGGKIIYWNDRDENVHEE